MQPRKIDMAKVLSSLSVLKLNVGYQLLEFTKCFFRIANREDPNKTASLGSVLFV